MGTHISKELEKYIGKRVMLMTHDGDVFTGYFDHSKQDINKDFESNLPYALRNVIRNGRQDDSTWHFYKSHIKIIGVVEGV